MMSRRKQQQGFTLIELMTSLSIFAIVVTISLGAILGIFNANRKSRSLRTAMSGLNLALETMSREMRYGTRYHCTSSGTLTDPLNCTSGDTFISFLGSDNVQLSYRLNGTILERSQGSEGYLPVTAPDLIIDAFTFYVSATDPNDVYQPKVFITVKGHVGTGGSRTDFALQTLVSQRALD
jgi:prepilin-type N-terminal cleavage/methylation domain-containing protein